jgi:nitrous oxidase accessory protein NosD
MSCTFAMTKGRAAAEPSPATNTELRMVVRMRRWTRTVLVLFLSLLLGLPATAAWAGGAKVRVVEPGESIQAAIDAASPGDTILVKPGTYAEALVVQTDDLTLKGSKGTVLTMPASSDNICTELSGGTVVGICALGEVNFETFEVIEYLEGPRISGFRIRGFTDSGIIALGTDGLRATGNWFEDNAGYGIFSLLSIRPLLAHNTASGNGDAGLYVGGNQDVDATVVGNTSWDNALGIFLRDVSNGSATGNHVFDNCTGILLLANAPGPVTNWTVRHNLVRRNNKTDCGEGGATSGTGILLLGASDNEVSKNVVVGNRGEAPFGGGIVLVTAEPEEPGGEALAPSGNVVRKNVALRNAPFDLSRDGTGDGNRFVDNLCRTSQPDGLCD